jgi:hypothetical protein
METQRLVYFAASAARQAGKLEIKLNLLLSNQAPPGFSAAGDTLGYRIPCLQFQPGNQKAVRNFISKIKGNPRP